MTQQSYLDALIEPQEYPQSIQVEYALCRDFDDAKDKIKVQRAVSKSGDGIRLRYVCQDSLENKDRKANRKKKEADAEDNDETTRGAKDLLPTYDCGGAIYVKFSIKRDAINVVYKHNPIHRDVESRRTGNG